MPTPRADLDHLNRDSSYLTLSVIFVFLSILGLLLFVQILKNRKPISTVPPTTIPTVTPADSDPQLYPSIPARTEQDLTTTQPAIISKLPDQPQKATTTTESTLQTPTPTPTILTFTTQSDNFSVVYSSSRKVYPDKESSGNRYTFYRADGNIALHLGSHWSWVYPDRQFNTDLTVAGKPTFRYDTNSQTIVDFQSNGLNYTVQCIHHGKSALQTECDQFLKNLRLL